MSQWLHFSQSQFCTDNQTVNIYLSAQPVSSTLIISDSDKVVKTPPFVLQEWLIISDLIGEFQNDWWSTTAKAVPHTESGRFWCYGFNLHAEKNKPGQFVGKIDPGSPAEIAGLKEGDREAAVIIAVLSSSLYCHVLILSLSWLIWMTENHFL